MPALWSEVAARTKSCPVCTDREKVLASRKRHKDQRESWQTPTVVSGGATWVMVVIAFTVVLFVGRTIGINL